MKNHSNKRTFGYIALSLALMLIIGSSATLVQDEAIANASVTTVSQSATVVQSPFTEAVQAVTNSVVSVNNYTMMSQRPQSVDPFGFGFGFGWGGYGDNFGGRNRGESSEEESREVQQGAGSGVVIANGYVLTNYHVIDGATRLEVAVDEETYEAVLSGSDEALDLAVLYVEKLPLNPVVLGDSDLLNVGDWAICIGNPLSFTRTATVGIISALNREISNSTTDAYGLRKEIVNQMIQTDAAINAGNSGGGMFNVAGELVGVPSLKYSSSAFSGASIEGIGMAIPINVAKPLIEEALNTKLPESATSDRGTDSITTGDKPRIGVSVTDINTSNPAVAAGILPRGAYVSDVEPDSPAEQAGLLPGDIVVEVDGTIISTTRQMVEILQAKQIGDIASVKVYRVEGGLEDIQSYEDIPEGTYIDLNIELAILGNVKQ